MILTYDGNDQWGLFANTASGNTTALNIGTQDYILEVLLADIDAWWAFELSHKASGLCFFYLKKDATSKLLFYFANVGGTECWLNCYDYATPASLPAVKAPYPYMPFRNKVFAQWIVRETSYFAIVNGVKQMTGSKSAHDLEINNITTLGVPSDISSSLVLLRMYIGDLSSFSDDDLLFIHRKNLQTPFKIPKELYPYCKFYFNGRKNLAGDQIEPDSTVVYNVMNGETLTIAGGKKWREVRRKIYQS